jgi:hypothetical protein
MITSGIKPGTRQQPENELGWFSQQATDRIGTTPKFDTT